MTRFNLSVRPNRIRLLVQKKFPIIINHQQRFIASWLKKKYVSLDNVYEDMRNVYTNKLLPLEERYLFHEFHSPRLLDQDFYSKPMVILVGQYSTGKTTLLKYLLGTEFPGLRIGPEPTTDRFIIIMHGNKDRVIPGNALVTDPTRQFRALSLFGNTFLNKIQCSLVNSSVLNSVTFVDTPGILAGEKQRLDRGYDFEKVLEWFSERADRIVLLFDANKLDISDEFRLTIEAVNRYDDKIRVILNKADSVDSQSLLRVYGALMWSLGKVFKTPEVVRVFVGSFWDSPLVHDNNRKLFNAEEQDLLRDIQTLPRQSALRKINDLNKRTRLAIVHAYIMGEIYKRIPTFFGKNRKKYEVIEELDEVYKYLLKTYNLSQGDFPDLVKMQAKLRQFDFKALSPLRIKMISQAEDMMATDIARIMNLLPDEDISDIKGGAFTYQSGDIPEKLVIDSKAWRVEQLLNMYKDKFLTLNPINGKLVKDDVKRALENTRLPDSVLMRICCMSDVDNDGLLDEEEFALAMHLASLKKNGEELPKTVPINLISISKRQLISANC